MSGLSVCVLGSGSEGNSTLVYTDKEAILVDAGFSCREIEKRLESIDFSPSRLDAIVVSHEHIDHIRGAEVLARKHGLTVYMTEGTLKSEKISEKLRKSGQISAIASEKSFSVGSMEVTPFEIPHDGSEPVAFMIKSGGRVAVNLTDVGFVTGIVVEYIRQANLAVVESNHDEELLAIGPYPWHLKERIAGRGGHLSNNECEELLGHAGGNGLGSVIFAHLSKINNNPDLVRQGAEKIFAGGGVKFEIASQYQPGSIFEV